MATLKATGFKPLDGFHTYLNSNLCGSDRWLDLADDLSQHLPEWDDWTTLAVRDGSLTEVVRARNKCGYIVFDRAVEGTKKFRFPADSYVEFIMTQQGVEAMVCNKKWFENCEEGV